MTLEELPGGTLRLVECPFCGADLRKGPPADHLRRCTDFTVPSDRERVRIRGDGGQDQ